MKKTLIMALIAAIALTLIAVTPAIAKNEEKSDKSRREEMKRSAEEKKTEKMEELEEKNPISSREAGYMKKINERLEKMQKEFDTEIAKLEAILAAAKEEDASKTAGLVEALIKEKTDEFDKQVAHFKEMRDKMLESYRARFEDMSQKRKEIEEKRGTYKRERDREKEDH